MPRCATTRSASALGCKALRRAQRRRRVALQARRAEARAPHGPERVEAPNAGVLRLPATGAAPARPNKITEKYSKAFAGTPGVCPDIAAASRPPRPQTVREEVDGFDADEISISAPTVRKFSGVCVVSFTRLSPLAPNVGQLRKVTLLKREIKAPPHLVPLDLDGERWSTSDALNTPYSYAWPRPHYKSDRHAPPILVIRP
jgi:hypothetical protein